MIKNAKVLPKVFYGLHMVEGVAEYKEPQVNSGQPYRIFVGEDCIKKMDPSYAGRPLYVNHVDDVNVDRLEMEADGYVVESFYNPADGKHWAKFIVVTDKGHNAIQNGWKLSNAYIPKKFSGGGKWHGVEYLKEVEEAEYEHLALVPNPRYDESIILTPEEFKAYNSKKESELKSFKNSVTEGAKAMFNFFKKTKVDNAADLESMSVVLPKTGKELTLASIINEMDEHHAKQSSGDDQMAHPEHYVQCGSEKMKVNQLVNKYMQMCKSAEEDAEKKKEQADHKAPEAPTGEPEAKKVHDESEEKPEEKKMDSDKPMKEKVMESADDAEALAKTLELAEHEVEEMKEKGMKSSAKKNAAHFDVLKNAEARAFETANKIELSEDRVARGRARYGSGN